VTASAPVAAAVGEPLRAGVATRSPRVVAALDGEQALVRARSWAAGAAPGIAVGTVRVGSVLYRQDGSCTLRYVVRLAPGAREQVLLVEVPRDGTDVLVRPFPADPGLPTLPHAVDPKLMRAVLGRVVPGTGGDRAIGRCAVDVVHHPRQGRCVLRYRLSPGAGGAGELRHPVVFGKVYGDSTAHTAAAALRVLRRGLPLLADGTRVDVPEPLAVVPPLRLGLVEAIAGEPRLPGLLKAACEAQAPSQDLSDAVRTAARLAAAVHRCALSGPPLPARDLAGERTAAEGKLALLEPVWPGVAARLRRTVEAVGAATPDGRSVAPVLAHGDFTPGQVLLGAPGRVGLVDVDTLCVAEPALDLGRFLAYLHVTGMRRSRWAWPLLVDLTALFLDSYLDASPATDARLLRARTAAYRALALTRLGVSACWQLKDDRLGAVVDVLDAGDEWMGSVAA
jgi:aminoglycoside phosphotransferase (APT) family kinase protein